MHIHPSRDLIEWPLCWEFEDHRRIAGHKICSVSRLCVRSSAIEWFSKFSLRDDLKCCDWFTSSYGMFTTYSDWTIQTLNTVMKRFKVNVGGTHSWQLQTHLYTFCNELWMDVMLPWMKYWEHPFFAPSLNINFFWVLPTDFWDVPRGLHPHLKLH